MEPDPADPDFDEWNELQDKVRSAALTGDVVDLAAGTGLWTELFIDSADTVTLIDAAAETLELARRRLGDENVSYVVADLFDWKPTRRYDALFSSFWLCHIPPDLVSGFIDRMAGACRPGGSVVLVDEHTFEDPGLAAAAARQEDPWVSHRNVEDGRRYRLVKASHDPNDIGAHFQQRGWQFTINHRGNHFYMLSATHPSS